MPQKLMSNIAIVKRTPDDVLIVRGMFVANEPQLAWLQSGAGTQLDVLVTNDDGYELSGRFELLSATVGRNVQGRHAFWHARFKVRSPCG